MKQISYFIFLCFISISAAAPLRDPFLTQSEALNTTLIHLHYLKSNALSDWLNKSSTQLLSKNGESSSYSDLNVLVIHDNKNHIKQIKAIIQQLDQPKPQITIKAEIVTIDTSALNLLGVLFNSSNDILNTSDHLNFDLPTNKPNSIRLPILNLGQRQTLNLEINALAEAGRAKIISKPEITTQDNKTAQIETGEELPYQEATSSGATSTSFRQAVLRLKVTPTQMPHNRISLNATVNQDKVSHLTVQGMPAIKTQKVTTQVLLKNNDTLVLGEIAETDDSSTEQSIPILKSLPIVGRLFRHDNNSHSTRELLILIQASEIP